MSSIFLFFLSAVPLGRDAAPRRYLASSLAFVIFCYNFVRLREQFSKGSEHPAAAAPVAPSIEQTHNPGYRRGKISVTVVPRPTSL